MITYYLNFKDMLYLPTKESTPVTFLGPQLPYLEPVLVIEAFWEHGQVFHTPQLSHRCALLDVTWRCSWIHTRTTQSSTTRTLWTLTAMPRCWWRGSSTCGSQTTNRPKKKQWWNSKFHLFFFCLFSFSLWKDVKPIHHNPPTQNQNWSGRLDGMTVVVGNLFLDQFQPF